MTRTTVRGASRAALGCALAALLPAAPALAQEVTGQSVSDRSRPAATDAPTQADIVITADRSTKTLQKTPIAVTVVSGAEISSLGRSKIDDVLQNVPGVVVQGGGKGFNIAIRGVGTDLPATGQGSVSQNFDGVYNARNEAGSAGFYDIDRVEVLRGPQGTLYGRNATAGVINVVSADPRLGEIGGYGEIEAGNYSLLHGEGAVNLPIGKTMAFRAAFSAVDRNGYLSNGHDDNVSTSGRAKFLFKPSDDFSLLLGVEYTKLGGKGPGAASYPEFLAGQHYVTTDTGVGSNKYQSWKYWAFVSAAIGPGELTVLPAHQMAHARELGSFGGNFTDAGEPNRARQDSIEVRYAARSGDRVQWSTGYYHYYSNGANLTYEGSCQAADGSALVAPDGYTYAIPLAPPGVGFCLPTPIKAYYQPAINQTVTDAVFGQVTYPLLDRLRLIAGARYTWDLAHQQQATGGVSGDVSKPRGTIYSSLIDKHFEYRGGIEFDLAARSLLYATVVRGHRGAGFNYDNTPYSPERLTSYEIGAKNQLLDGRLSLNGDFFYYDYSDFQLTTFGIDPNTNAIGLIFTNLPTARDYGAELESQYQPTRNDNLSFSVTYLDTKLTSNAAGSFTHYDGAPFPHSPRWSLKGGYSHSIDLGGAGSLAPRVDARYLTRQFVVPVGSDATSADPQSQGAYATADVSLLYTSANGRWSANAYVKNVSDKAVKLTYSFGYAVVGAPRTYGATLTVRM